MKQSKKLMDFFEKYILFELHYIISHICMSVRLSESFCGNSLVSNFLVKITLTNEHLFFNYFIGLSISYSFASYGRMNVLFIVFCIYWLRNPVNIFVAINVIGVWKNRMSILCNNKMYKKV